MCVNRVVRSRRVFGSGVGRVVGRDMEVVRWEERKNVSKDVMEEGEDMLVGGRDEDMV